MWKFTLALACCIVVGILFEAGRVDHDSRCRNGDEFTELLRNRARERVEIRTFQTALAKEPGLSEIVVLDVRGPRAIVADHRGGTHDPLDFVDLTGVNERLTETIARLWHETFVRQNPRASTATITPVDLAFGRDADSNTARLSVSPNDCVSL